MTTNQILGNDKKFLYLASPVSKSEPHVKKLLKTFIRRQKFIEEAEWAFHNYFRLRKVKFWPDNSLCSLDN